MKFFPLLLLFSSIGCVGQETSELISYPSYSITDDRLKILLREHVQDLTSCLNDTVVLSYTLYISKFKNSERADTNVALEIAPFFTWKNVGRNYYGVTHIDSLIVFIRENESELWLKSSGSEICFNQKVIGDFKSDYFVGDNELPNSIYQSIKCYYRLENGVFVVNGEKCNCME